MKCTNKCITAKKCNFNRKCTFYAVLRRFLENKARYFE